MESYGSGTFRTRRWRCGTRWTAKHASSLQLTSAKMGNTPSSAPMMADASSMTQRCPAELLLFFFLLFMSLLLMCHDKFMNPWFNQMYFSFVRLLASEIPHSDSREVHQRQKQSWTQNHWHWTFTWREQGTSSANALTVWLMYHNEVVRLVK